MLEYAFPRFKTQIQAIKRAIPLFQNIHYPQRLQVVLEPPVVFHAAVQRILTGMTEGRMTKIVRQRDGLDQILIELQIACDRTADLRHFQAVRQARAEQIAFTIDENLGLVLEPPERGGMNDAVPVALKYGTPRRRVF